MTTPAPDVRLPPAGAVSILLLALLLSAPFAVAQTPEPPHIPDPEEFNESTLGIVLSTREGYVEVPFFRNGGTRFTIHDVSGDSGKMSTGGTAGTTAKPHFVDVKVANLAEVMAAGWQVQLGSTSFQMFGGDEVPVDVVFVPTAQVSQQLIVATIQADFVDRNTGHQMNSTINLTAQVMPYGRGLARLLTPPQDAGQFEIVKYEVLVVNDAVYPDFFTIEARADKEGYQVYHQPSIYVPALESRTFTVSVQTPKGKPYELGESANLNIRVTSQQSGAEYPVTGILKVEGPYLSSYWYPLFLVGLISAGILERNRRKWRELRRLEKGRPRRVQPTPRQAVLLAELKRKDPEAFLEKKQRLDTLYKARRQHYREERRTIDAADKEERRQAKVEFIAAKKRKQAERKAARVQAKIDRKEAAKQRKLDNKAAKVQRKLDKKQAKVEAKEAKKLEKVLAKKRKQLEKAKAKAAKQEAKRAKVEARAAKKAERAARKSAKGR